MLLAAHFGALVPDIDSGTADIWEHVPFGGVAGRAANTFLAHRNFTHSLLAAGLIGWLVYELLTLLPVYWGIDAYLCWLGFMIGFGAHLLADMLTIQGLPLLWPWQRSFGLPPKPLEGVRIVSGGWFEQLVLFPILNLSLILIVWAKWSVLSIWLFRGP
jgi:inner membrane protein